MLEHSRVTRSTWTREEAELAAAGLPSHLARAVILARYTGQRRGDLCAMGWTAYDGVSIQLVQLKTKAPLVLPVHSVLKVHLDAWPRIAATILTNAHDRPRKPQDLSYALPAA
jgi:integrase